MSIPVVRQEFPGCRRKVPRLCPHRDRSLLDPARSPPASRPQTSHSRPHDRDLARVACQASLLEAGAARRAAGHKKRKVAFRSPGALPLRAAPPGGEPVSAPASLMNSPAGATHLAQLFATHGTVSLFAQHPHLGRAAVAHRVVAAAQGRGL